MQPEIITGATELGSEYKSIVLPIQNVNLDELGNQNLVAKNLTHGWIDERRTAEKAFAHEAENIFEELNVGDFTRYKKTRNIEQSVESEEGLRDRRSRDAISVTIAMAREIDYRWRSIVSENGISQLPEGQQDFARIWLQAENARREIPERKRLNFTGETEEEKTKIEEYLTLRRGVLQLLSAGALKYVDEHKDEDIVNSMPKPGSKIKQTFALGMFGLQFAALALAGCNEKQPTVVTTDASVREYEQTEGQPIPRDSGREEIYPVNLQSRGSDPEESIYQRLKTEDNQSFSLPTKSIGTESPKPVLINYEEVDINEEGSISYQIKAELSKMSPNPEARRIIFEELPITDEIRRIQAINDPFLRNVEGLRYLLVPNNAAAPSDRYVIWIRDKNDVVIEERWHCHRYAHDLLRVIGIPLANWTTIDGKISEQDGGREINPIEVRDWLRSEQAREFGWKEIQSQTTDSPYTGEYVDNIQDLKTRSYLSQIYETIEKGGVVVAIGSWENNGRHTEVMLGIPGPDNTIIPILTQSSINQIMENIERRVKLHLSSSGEDWAYFSYIP